MLLNLYKKKWNDGLKNKNTVDSRKDNNKSLEKMARLTKDYAAWIKLENEKTIKEFAVSSTGKLDPKRHLKEVKFKNHKIINRIILYYKENIILNIFFDYFYF